MSVLILTNHEYNEYETSQLLDAFYRKGISSRICLFKYFDIVINDNIYYGGERITLPKVVLVRLGAGISRAELAIVRYFELAGVFVINSSNSIDLVQDKFHTSELLNRAGIPVPTTMLAKYPITHDLVETHIGFPCIIKVTIGSFGVGVYMCQTKQEYLRVIEFANSLDESKVLIVQEYLGDHPGEDLRVFVIGGKVIGAMKRTAPAGDFRANISHGGTGSKFELTPEIESLALATANALNLDIAGIDLLFDKRGFRVCEANSNPGFYGFDKYCKTNVAEIIADYIESKL